MVSTLGAFGALFAAAFVFLTGNGLLNTLLSARMAAEGFSTGTTGIECSTRMAWPRIRRSSSSFSSS